MFLRESWRRLARDTALMTGSSLLLRFLSMAFQVWLVGRIGQSGIGLFQLIGSVNMLIVTFAVSGIRFASTRLIAEELGAGFRDGALRARRRCLGYALFFGTSAMAVMLLCAEPVGFLWIGDARCVRSLKISAVRLPFIAVSSVLNGYFIAAGKAARSAVIQTAEQLISIALIAALLVRVPVGNIELACAAVSLGGTAADVISMLLCCASCIADGRGRTVCSGCGERITARMFSIAIPLALSAYARTSLTTLQNLLVPRMLRRSGMTADRALAGYGCISGMVFPVISFPSCILCAAAELIVPELTAAQVIGRKDYIESTVSALLRACLAFSGAAAIFLLLTGDALGYLIYGDASAGRFIRIFALIAPVMYTDIIVDGCLKGLGQMMQSMTYNIAEAVLGVALTAVLLPRWGLEGYLAMIFACEIFNFSFSLGRLRRVTGLRLFSRRGMAKGRPAA